jgi:hypothetical protein
MTDSSNNQRTLIYFPILHTQADLGKMGTTVKQTTAGKEGAPTWELHSQVIEHLWSEIDHVLGHLPLDYAKVRVYQDGLPVCGHELSIVTELAAAGSRNHHLLLRLHEAGAILMGTEEPELLLEEYQLIVQMLQGAESPETNANQLELGRQLLERRDQFIATHLITYQFLPPAKSRQGKVILQAPLQST